MGTVRVEIEIVDFEPNGGPSGSARRTAARLLVAVPDPTDPKKAAWREALRVPQLGRVQVSDIWEDAIPKVVEETGKLLALHDLEEAIREAREQADNEAAQGAG